jgi:hypothetical protein
MDRNLRLARPFLVMALVFGAIRFSFAPLGLPYNHPRAQSVSLVVLTLVSAVLYAAFARRFLTFGIAQAMGLGFTLAVIAQAVIIVATLASFATGTTTYFNHPMALVSEAEAKALQAPIPFATDMGTRFFGLVVNSVLGAVAGALGWALGALLPEKA